VEHAELVAKVEQWLNDVSMALHRLSREREVLRETRRRSGSLLGAAIVARRMTRSLHRLSSATAEIAASAFRERRATLGTELMSRRVLGSALSADCREPSSALGAELGPGRSLGLAAGTFHLIPPATSAPLWHHERIGRPGFLRSARFYWWAVTDSNRGSAD
jgi:hypothetical protein